MAGDNGGGGTFDFGGGGGVCVWLEAGGMWKDTQCCLLLSRAVLFGGGVLCWPASGVVETKDEKTIGALAERSCGVCRTRKEPGSHSQASWCVSLMR